MNLNDKILEIVNQHSGGIKFTELIVHLTKWVYESKLKLSLDPEYIISVIKATSGLEILHYTWKQCNREKLFIYTP